MIGKAQQLKEKSGMSISLILFDKTLFDKKELEEMGVSKVYNCHEKLINNNQMADISEKIIKESKAGLVLLSSTQRAKALAATISTRMNVGLTADCIDVEYTENGKFVFCRSAISDSVIAKIENINCHIAIGTIKKDVFKIPKSKSYNKCKSVEINIEAQTEDFFKLIKCKEIEKKTLNIDNYKLLFCIGRGVSKDACQKIKKLSEKFNAAIIGTRAAVEDGLIEKDCQVGQSGISVSPNVYIGFGVSGACQHIVGIQNSNIIIAINHDQKAPIFNYSDYKVVADVDDVVDAMLKMN